MSALLAVYERELTLVRGKGARLFDREGRSYLDFAAGIGVNGLGYGDPKVLAAIKKQAAQLIHTSNLFHTEAASALAERLVALAFPSRVFFCNSGSEAWEGALKFARKIGKPQGRVEYLCFERAFHGRTMGALSTTWNPKYREPFEPLVPGVRFLPWNDLSAVAAALTEQTAAVMLEPIQGEGGVRPAPPSFLQGLRKLTQEKGALLVLDEVQCGLGRTGKMFAFQHAGIVPDILTLAKPLGGGLPMGAVLVREELAPAIAVGDHGSTFGGNPVAAAASLAVLDRLSSPGFLEGVARRGASLVRGLKKLARAHPSIAEVRGLGLMVGLELTGEAGPVVKALRERGFLATKAGDKVLRLLPPLVVKPAEIKAFLVALEDVLKGGRAVAPGGHGETEAQRAS
jgi:predicted acetylornithine/succinylornithine family transaminase